jgi:hypothetical protein
MMKLFQIVFNVQVNDPEVKDLLFLVLTFHVNLARE